jgi:hypothetical protein
LQTKAEIKIDTTTPTTKESRKVHMRNIFKATIDGSKATRIVAFFVAIVLSKEYNFFV